MKKLALIVLLIIAVSPVGFAAESTEEMLKQKVYGLLTEVYGYTQAEAETFGVHVAQEDGEHWYLYFYLHPDWVYTATLRKQDLGFEESHTPFGAYGTVKTSENSVRYVLRAVKDNGWFDNWNADSKAAFGEAVAWCGDIQANASLERGLQSDDYTPAQALEDFFLSCYGDASLWYQELKEWKDLVFYSFGLTGVEEPAAAATQGLLNRTEDDASICEFVGEVPDALSHAFSVPQLAGWECLTGAYQTGDRFSLDGEVEGTGLAAFGKGDERLLALLVLETKTHAWRVIPVGNAALLPGRKFTITYVSSYNRFNINYPISDTGQETFQCRFRSIGTTPEADGQLCELMEYRYINTLEDKSVVIAYNFNNPFSSFYTVTTTQDGNKTQTRYPAFASNMLDYIDVSVFPRTEEACAAASAQSPSIPEGYGYSSSVHLRADTSSHAKDMRMYRKGTLVEVLDVLPGSEFPWLRVRIGDVEGYMSSNYVAYQSSSEPTQLYISLSMAKTKGAAALKGKTGVFSDTILDLPEGTVVRVLAEIGNWLHVSVPKAPYHWLMQPDEVIGFVKADAVVQAATALQLSWLLPDK